MMTNDGEPTGKLDATATPSRVAGANGPEDDLPDWRQINWRKAEGDVARLRQRIFAATRAGDLAKVRNLQKLMLRSHANALLSVRRVTELNAGRRTAGIDGETAVSDRQKAALVASVTDRRAASHALPVRRVYIPKAGGSGKLRAPSAEAVRRIRRRLSAEMLALRGANVAAVLSAINPIVRGWSAYYRGVVSTETFQNLDGHLWRLPYKWACFRHNGRSKRWIVKRYFGQFHPARRDRWVFGDRDSGRYLIQFAWTKIIRHDLVKHDSSPDDATLTGYWAKRRRKAGPEPPLPRSQRRQLKTQHGRCAVC